MQQHGHCDVLIVGAGPAGIAAALAAIGSDVRVWLADEQAEFGGELLASEAPVDGQPTALWLKQSLHKLANADNITLLPRTTVTSYLDYNYCIAVQRLTDHLGPAGGGDTPRQRLWKIRAGKVVLATGAIERPIVFPDNDRPGVMLAGAVRTYINRYRVLAATKLVVFTNNDSGYETALAVHKAGAQVTVIDVRSEPGW